MLRRRVKLAVVALVVVFALSCFAGCKAKKDVYGAASDFIKVSHPEKPNTNVFSDEDYGVSQNNSSQAASSGTKDSSGKSNSNESDPKTDPSDSSATTSSTDTSSKSNSSVDVVSFEGDFGPIVDVP